MKIELKGNWRTKKVWLNGKVLTPKHSQKSSKYRSDDFSWGDGGGGGSSQLALAILLKLADKYTAILNHELFKRDIIIKLPKRNFIYRFDITSYIRSGSFLF